MGTKNDPGEYDCYANAKDDEPMFVLLARDPIAPVLVHLWVMMRGLMGKMNPEKDIGFLVRWPAPTKTKTNLDFWPRSRRLT